MMMGTIRILATLALASLAGCNATDLEGGATEANRSTDHAVVVDSAIPIDVLLDRFRTDVPEAPTALAGGHPSPEALVREMLDLLSAADTAGFERIAVDRAEFAWLIYPESPMSRQPYELPPALMWFRTQQENRTGVLRMLRELGGKEFPAFVLRCPDEGSEQGRNHMLGGCTLQFGDDSERRLFASLVERDGQWKVFSFANDY